MDGLSGYQNLYAPNWNADEHLDPDTRFELGKEAGKLFTQFAVSYPVGAVPQAASIALHFYSHSYPPEIAFVAMNHIDDETHLAAKIANMANTAHSHYDTAPNKRMYAADVRRTMLGVFGLATAIESRMIPHQMRELINDHEAKYKARGQTGDVEYTRLLKDQLHIPQDRWWPRRVRRL